MTLSPNSLAPSDAYPLATEPLRVLYVGGWGRSGSTVLDLLLGSVPGLVSVGELRDVWWRGYVENRRCGCGSPFRTCSFWTAVGREAFGEDGWAGQRPEELARLRFRVDRPWYAMALVRGRGSDAYERRLIRFLGAQERIYRAVAIVSGAHTIVDSSKMATYAMLLRRSRHLDIRIVHLVRDPRGVAYSWGKHVDRGDGTGERDELVRYGTLAASGRYLLYHGLAAALARTGLPYLRIRYEDMVADPNAVLSRVLDHADESADDMPEFRDGTIALNTSHTVDGNPVRLSHKPLCLRGDDAWHRALSPGRKRAVTFLTYPLLRQYGYRGTH